MLPERNADQATIKSFGDEWSRFDQSELSREEAQWRLEGYFSTFPWERLPANAIGFDMGCGSGRWARLIAERVGHLHCIEPSRAVEVARRNLRHTANVTIHHASADNVELPSDSQDFGYVLGVLHHIPDTAEALRSCVRLLKPGAPLLVYMYYALDNRPWAFRIAWLLSDRLRRLICRLPLGLRNILADVMAILVYLPLAVLASGMERLGLSTKNMPLAYYRKCSFYTMRTDSRDRFGTPLEKRFTRDEIVRLMGEAGLVDVVVSPSAPFWCAVGCKR